MFTGIVEETGVVEEAEHLAAGGAILVVRARTVLDDLQVGGSISVNGCCLTAVAIRESTFRAELSPETLKRTNLGALASGSTVNLERPLLPTTRLSGHFVLGHVDGKGTVEAIDAVGDGNWWLSVSAPRELAKFLVYKGSIAIDGISLTIASLEDSTMGVAIIPHTYEVTALASLRVGSEVNLECDMLAKHVHRLFSMGESARGDTVPNSG